MIARGGHIIADVSKSGVQFAIGGLEDFLYKGHGQCGPSNISHDMHWQAAALSTLWKVLLSVAIPISVRGARL